jgi:ribosomal RNA-processing protein 1
MDDPSIQQTPFVKQLAANGIALPPSPSHSTNPPIDRPTRDKALSSLRTYLSGRRSLPPLELLKLHKGLFYCMWMADRPLPQQQLATSLSSLVFILPPATVIPFLRAFWQTMQREWTNIDVLRMEKFLLLTRRYMGASLEVLAKSEWDGEKVGEMVGLWEEIPFNMSDPKIPNGMRFHCIDIFVDELERVGALEEERGLLEELLGPLRRLASGNPTKAVRVKAKEALGDERLPGNESKKGEEGGDGKGGEEEWGGIKD